MKVDVRPGTIEEVLSMQKDVPEMEADLDAENFKNKLMESEYLILIAQVEGDSAGFKVGYDRYLDGKVFYSWVGGVLPEYRHEGIGRLLMEKTEIWARLKGYEYLKFKAQNKHRSMIHFAISNGFDVVGLEPKDDRSSSEIYFEKRL